jgi:hypothetical protein
MQKIEAESADQGALILWPATCQPSPSDLIKTKLQPTGNRRPITSSDIFFSLIAQILYIYAIEDRPPAVVA